jgi:large subunit ribosomal protein L30
MPEKKLAITLIKSPIGNQNRAKRTLHALGFTKLKQTVTQPDNPSIRGMLYLVNHLVTITETEE